MLDALTVKGNATSGDVFSIMLTAEQIRAARALLRWSARELAEKSGVSLPTIQRLEVAEGVPGAIASTLDKIERSLSEAGVQFIPQNGGGVGVRMRNRR